MIRTHQGGPYPRALLIPATLAVAVVAVPLLGMIAQVPWPRFVELVTAPSSLEALWLSLRTCLVATLLCVLIGAPLALVLGRTEGRMARAIRILVTLPLVLPPVVAGLALLATLGRQGVLGGTLEAMGVRIAFSTTAVVIAQVFVSMPYLVIALEGAVRTAGHRYEDVAATLGARPATVLRRITLPLLAPALASGTALAFARCLGEFGATLTFAGSLEGVTRTLPLEIYLQREVSQEAALALSVLLLAVAVLVVAATSMRRRQAAPTAGGDVDEAEEPADAAAGTPDASATAGTSATAGATTTEPSLEPAPSLAVHAAVARRGVEAAVDVEGGRVLAVLGANGSGKSTLLGLLSGLVTPSSGTVTLGTTEVAGARGELAPHRRDVGVLTQDPLLFPHLSVLENVAFGPRARGTAAVEAHRIARAHLADVDALALADRAPATLSGGQQQRVALARALAARPGVLLLDEPLSALDVDVAARMRALLGRVVADGRHTVVIVTHDLLDVLALADDVAVLEAGQVAERGPALDVLRRPRTPFLARLAGLVLVPGRLARTDDRGGSDATAPPGPALVVPDADGNGAAASATASTADATPLAGLLAAPMRADTQVVAAFRPSAVALYAPGTATEGSPRNRRTMTVTALEPMAGLVRVHGTAGFALAADVTPDSAAALDLHPGARVDAVVKAAEVDVYARAVQGAPTVSA